MLVKRVLVVVGLISVCAFFWLSTRNALSIVQRGGSTGPIQPTGAPVSRERVEQRLLAAGLHPTGLLSDLGVDDHLARLDAGEVDATTLMAYADAIETLTMRGAERGQALPPALWDVSTPALLASGWTVYSLTEALASEEGGIHVELLSDAYGAFLASRPDALEGALALLPLARRYVQALPEEARAEHAAMAQTNGEATLLIWQALLSGTHRDNPITHRPLWSHGFVGHFSVPHVHQYATGEGLTPSQVWGVEGFNPAFVGPPSNVNQVEHMGISALLQGVADIPLAVLNAQEGLEVAVDHEDSGAAAADRALNGVIRDVLLPLMEAEPLDLTAALREALR